MKKIPLDNICEYYADAERGKIFSRRLGIFAEKHTFIEKGRNEPRVTLALKSGFSKNFRVGYLILGTFTGFRDKSLWSYRFINGDVTDPKLTNLEWVERYGFVDIFSPEEWDLYLKSLDWVRQTAWKRYNSYLNNRIKELDPETLKNPKERIKTLQRIFKVKIKEVRNVDDIAEIDFSGYLKNNNL